MREGATIHILDDTAALHGEAARHIVEQAARAIDARGAFHIALAGGATPEGVYRRLHDGEAGGRVDWSRVHIYFGDERCVPPDHPDSNYRMAREALLDHVPVPAEQVHRMAGEVQPAKAAREYARLLEARLPRDDRGRRRFDLVLLGMGPDGHVASLFPDTDVLRRRVAAAAVYVPKLDSWRLTVTLPTINAARHVALMVTGEKKADVVRHVFRDDPDAAPLPVQMVRPAGRLDWFLDAEAARLLPSAP